MTGQQTTAEASRGPLTIGPRSLERPADAGHTLVGGIDDPRPARVDRGGAIAPPGASWHLDWWIGADDRWYLPAREPSVRQRRHGPGPVIETSMRVPSGDVTTTAFPVVVGARRAVVMEIANDSPVPVVLAVALRPGDLDGSAGARARATHRIDLADRAITVDGRPAVLLPRDPNERVALDDTDVVELVRSGGELSWDEAVTGRWATAACLYPLPHGTSLRFVVPTDDGIGPIAVDGLPPAETVATGWASIVDRAATFGFPDPGLTELVGAARSRLILAAPGLPDRLEALDHRAAAILEALALGGHADECLPSLRRLADVFPARLPAEVDGVSGPVAAAATVRAVATAAELLDRSLAQSLLESTAQLTSLADRKGDEATGTQAKTDLARLVERAGQPDAARHLRSGVPSSMLGPEPGAPATLDDVVRLSQQAGPAGSWPPDDDPAAAARYVMAARGLLLTGRPTGDRPEIDLLATMPSAWLGGEIEVHRAPAAGFRVSYAIRWHGYRPALLWELHDDHDFGQTPLLRCPGLDPAWSSRERSGETLLTGSAVELPDAPSPGDSFQ